MLHIIYEDKTLLAVEKPAGLPTLPTPKGTKNTVATEIEKMFPAQAALPDCGIVHRLDNDTSGIVLIAKSEEVYHQLRKIWNTLVVKKTYLAIVLGNLRGSGTITTPIAHHPKKKNKMVQEGVLGRPAVTHWKSQGACGKDGNFSLIEVSIATGVRHQIRVHLASIGHPLAGDRLYQTTKQQSKNPQGLPHHLLCLSQLVLRHPAKEPVEWLELRISKPLELSLKIG